MAVYGLGHYGKEDAMKNLLITTASVVTTAGGTVAQDDTAMVQVENGQMERGQLAELVEQILTTWTR